MPKIWKKRSRKAGLPPGSLIYTGDKGEGEVQITVIEYDDSQYEERLSTTLEECLLRPGKPTVTWIKVEGVHRTENLQQLGECFHLHPLVLEDILNTDQRPKVEDFEEYLFIVLKMLTLKEGGGVAAEQISLVLGSNYLISFQEGLGEIFLPIQERLKVNKGRLRKAGADYLAYALIDLIVDQYFVVLEQLGESIEFLEEEVVTRPTPKTLQDVHHFKGEMIRLRRSVWPLREVISQLERRESPLITEPMQVYFKDVYDHTIVAIESIESYRDILSGILDIYLSSVSNRLNQIMKVLTIIATIFMPLTFLAGVYGMNFKYMPELQWHYGYFTTLAVMALVALSMLALFKKKKWF
jgi:magnesium transporter